MNWSPEASFWTLVTYPLNTAASCGPSQEHVIVPTFTYCDWDGELVSESFHLFRPFVCVEIIAHVEVPPFKDALIVVAPLAHEIAIAFGLSQFTACAVS